MNLQKNYHMHLINELRLEPNDYRNYLRMNEDSFIQLLELVSPLIQKDDTIMRSPITPYRITYESKMHYCKNHHKK